MKPSTRLYCFIVLSMIMWITHSCNQELKIEPEQSKSFIRFFGNSYQDHASDILQTDDGGYVITGSTQAVLSGLVGYFDVFIMKINKYGNIEWGPKIFNNGMNDESKRVLATGDGGYLVIGSTEITSQDKDIWVIKTTSTGDSLWTKTYGGSNHEEGFTGFITNQGDYVVAGYTESFGAAGKDYWILQLNENGDINWSLPNPINFGLPGDQVILDAYYTNESYFFIGYESSAGNESEVMVAEVPANGRFILKNNLEVDATSCVGNGIIVHEDGSFRVLTTMILENGQQKSGIIKFDGNILAPDQYSYKYFDIPGNQKASSISSINNGGYIITGTVVSGGNNDLYLLKLDHDLNMIFKNNFGNASDQEGYRVIQTSDDGFAVAGTSNANGDWQVLVLKTATDGNL